MCCTEVIKKNITAIQTESANNRRAIENKAIDTYLDIILDSQKEIRDISGSVDKLYELLHSSFSSFSKEDYSQIAVLHKALIRDLSNLYIIYKKSSVYQGIKMDLKTFKNSIDNLREIDNDMKVFIVDLPQNREYKEIINVINSL